MELKVYNGENFERGKNWYFAFVLFIIAVIVVSVLCNNLAGGILVFLVAGGYIFFSTKSNEIINMVIGKNALQIGRTALSWDRLEGFVLEYHTKKEKIHNIVILEGKNNPRIYTIQDPDDEENLQNFVSELENYIPMLETYNQSTFDKFIRKIKL